MTSVLPLSSEEMAIDTGDHDEIHSFFSSEHKQKLKESIQIVKYHYDLINTSEEEAYTYSHPLRFDHMTCSIYGHDDAYNILYATACDNHCAFSKESSDERFSLISGLELYLDVGDIIFINVQAIDHVHQNILQTNSCTNPMICLNRVFCHKSSFGKPPYYVLHIQPNCHLLTLRNVLCVIDFNRPSLKILSGVFLNRHIRHRYEMLGLNSISYDPVSAFRLNDCDDDMRERGGYDKSSEQSYAQSKRELWITYFRQISTMTGIQSSGFESLFKSVYVQLLDYTSTKLAIDSSSTTIELSCQKLQMELLNLNRFIYFRKKTILFLAYRMADHKCNAKSDTGKFMLPILSKENMDLYTKYYTLDINNTNNNNIVLDDDSLLPKMFIETADLTHTAMNFSLLIYFTFIMLKTFSVNTLSSCKVCHPEKYGLLKNILTSPQLLPEAVTVSDLMEHLVKYDLEANWSKLLRIDETFCQIYTGVYGGSTVSSFSSDFCKAILNKIV